jgi:N-acetylneuraminic acid mutarotase
MQKKSASQFGFFSPRALIALLLCAAAACSILTVPLLAFLRPETRVQVSNRTLTFAERVSYQRAIEAVYWRHRIWPKERPDPKPSLDAVMSQPQFEKKVADYLRKSQALDDYWQRPLTAEQLQAEMERMAKRTKQPDVLRELFEALGNDPFVIAECLARPALAERLLTSWYAYDQRIYGELKQRAETDLLTHPSVVQIKQLSGNYSEVELVKSDRAHEKSDQGNGRRLQLNSREWDKTVQKLAAMFSARAVGPAVSPARGMRLAQITVGIISSLQEDETRYYATAVLNKADHQLKLGMVSWLKEPLESWLVRAEEQLPVSMTIPAAAYTLIGISDGTACIDNSWTATITQNAPDARELHTAVWTGSEMIIWGGFAYPFTSLDTGARYVPSTDSWIATSTTGAPAARSNHTAVWTGNEMIVWGGIAPNSYFNTGGRYNPGTDSWVATSTANAPAGREEHTAVWTGGEMIVWGGYDGNNAVNSGGRYNPSTNSWTATTTNNAPTARDDHTAIWTGTEMIVWGGFGYNAPGLNTGGKYNPATNSWTPTNTIGAPAARFYHTAVWTGTEMMIVWGGQDQNFLPLNSGGRYNPGTNS